MLTGPSGVGLGDALPELVTDRLILRQWHPTDLPAMHEMDSDPDVYKYLDGESPGPDYDVEQSEFIASCTGLGLGVWAILPRGADRRFIGIVMLVPLGGHGPQVELGFRLTRSEWGLGIAREAASAVINYGFRHGLRQIVAVTDSDNENSERTLRRLGFRRRGWRRAWGWWNHYFVLRRCWWEGIQQ